MDAKRWLSAIPIVRHDYKNQRTAGKAPGTKAWQLYAAFDGAQTSDADRAEWQRSLGDYAPGTGIGCGRYIVPDIDFKLDPEAGARLHALAFEVLGPTPFVRQGEAPKVALIYRAAEPIPSSAFKVPADANDDGTDKDRQRDGIDILAEGRQFVAYGVHRGTGRPYRWIGGAEPLTRGPEAAPEVTKAQVDEFVRRAREIVPLVGGTGGRGRDRSGESPEIVRDASGLVTDGREAHLTRIVWEAGRDVFDTGEPVTVDAIMELAWPWFLDSTWLDDGKWTLDHVVRKAHALVERFERGAVSFGQKPAAPEAEAASEPIEPTYRGDKVMPLAEGETRLRVLIGSFLADYVFPYKIALAAWKAEAEEARERGAPIPPKPTVRALAVKGSTGLGKTREIEALIEAAAAAGLSVVYAGPHHAGLEEMKGRLTERSALSEDDVEIWRGREQPDPLAPGHTMCRDLPAYDDALRAGVDPYAATCKSGKNKCQFSGVCGMERLRAAKPRVWLVTHASLFSRRPRSMPHPDLLIVDENPMPRALPSKPAMVAFDAFEGADPAAVKDAIQEAGFVTLGGVPTDPDPEKSAGNDAAWFELRRRELRAYNKRLSKALRASWDGELTRAALEEHGVNSRIAEEARKNLDLALRPVTISPGMTARARAEQLERAEYNRPIRKLLSIWREIERFLEDGHAESGRLVIGQHKETGARVIEFWPLDRIQSGWRAPILFSDATAAPGEAIEPVFEMPVDEAPAIEVRHSPHVVVTQILGAPVTAAKLGTTEDVNDEEDTDAADEDLEAAAPEPEKGRREPAGEEAKRSRRDLLRYIRARAAEAWPGRIGVVCTKKLRKRLVKAGLPENVDIKHFGALAGLDDWKRHRGAIIIGRQMPGPLAFEPQAGALFGCKIERCPPPLPPARMTWYPRVPGGLRMADGSAVRVEHERHRDPRVEVLRWQAAEAQVLQAYGRLRALRREADNPCWTDIVSDFPLPLTIDRVVRWADVKLGSWAGLFRDGIVLRRVADLMAAHELTEKAARLAVPPDPLPIHEPPPSALNALKSLPYKLRGGSGGDVEFGRRVRFQRRGAAEISEAYLLPEAPSDLFAALVAQNLGPIAWIEVDGGPRMTGPGTPEAIGIVLDSPGDTARMHPDTYPTEKAAERARAKAGGAPKPAGWVSFRYKHPGARQNWRTGRFDPAKFGDPADAWARIEFGLGVELAAFEAPEAVRYARTEPAKKSPAPLGAFVGASILGAGPLGGWHVSADGERREAA